DDPRSSSAAGRRAFSRTFGAGPTSEWFGGGKPHLAGKSRRGANPHRSHRCARDRAGTGRRAIQTPERMDEVAPDHSSRRVKKRLIATALEADAPGGSSPPCAA